MEHYFDNAATTKTCREAVDAALHVMQEVYGNPSSTHLKGREAKKLLDSCRKNVADALGAEPSEVVFTSCGSESDNWALLSGAEAGKRRGKHIISSTAEHDAIRKTLEVLEKKGFEVTRLKPDKTGKIRTEDVLDALRDDTVLISLMLVNNETGAVTDIGEICREVKKRNPEILVHTDAVQGFLKVPFPLKTLGADMISVSGHKIHAVKGIGALYIKKGLRLPPYLNGGEQEDGRRAGTEAMPQIASFAAACTQDPCIEKMREMKRDISEKLRAAVPEIRIIETEAPHILNVSMPGWRSEVLMNHLETYGVYVSKSSACKQGKRSHVLEALGLPGDVIDGTLRIGISRYTTGEDIETLLEGLKSAKSLVHGRR